MTATATAISVQALSQTTAVVREVVVKTGDVASSAVEVSSVTLQAGYQKTVEAAAHAADKTSLVVREVYQIAEDVTSSAAGATSTAIKSAFEKTGDAAGKISESTKQALVRQNDSKRG